MFMLLRLFYVALYQDVHPILSGCPPHCIRMSTPRTQQYNVPREHNDIVSLCLCPYVMTNLACCINFGNSVKLLQEQPLTKYNLLGQDVLEKRCL